MSRLLVVTHPDLVTGFQLAGVEASGADQVAEAEQLIGAWLDAGETGLLAVDEELLAGLSPRLRRRLEASDRLPCLAIPTIRPHSPGRSRRQQIAELIRRAIGVQVTFRGETA